MSTTREAATSTPLQEQGRSPLLLRIVPELLVLALCAVLVSTTGDMTTSAAGPGPAFYPRSGSRSSGAPTAGRRQGCR
jgi:hypothetical protein